jgi:hypothetical protein
MNPFRQLDSVLRGEATRLETLRAGSIDIPAGTLTLVSILLGMVYGAFMGIFALTGSGHGQWQQILASMLKVPALFFLTLLVTLPSLYVFNALVGSRLSLASVVRLLVAAIAVMMAVLASLGPIVAFFAISTTSYSFMVLLNVVVFAISGILGLSFLLQTLHRLAMAMLPAPQMLSAAPVPVVPAEGEEPNQPPPLPPPAPHGPLDPLSDSPVGPKVRTIFRIWIIVFGLVGAQMAWLMRPFIGNPEIEFSWFRPRAGNFFEAVAQHIGRLFN